LSLLRAGAAGTVGLQHVHICLLCWFEQAGNSTIGAIACLPCQPGTYNASQGASSCDQCAAGSFSANGANPASTACTLCDVGRYARVAGLTDCVNCGEGTFTNHTGSSAW
jgi:hypothetical protein